MRDGGEGKALDAESGVQQARAGGSRKWRGVPLSAGRPSTVSPPAAVDPSCQCSLGSLDACEAPGTQVGGRGRGAAGPQGEIWNECSAVNCSMGCLESGCWTRPQWMTC